MLLIIQGILRYNMSTSQKTAIITLNPKGENDELLTNWRPVSLTTCDYKIFTKILLYRLRGHSNIISLYFGPSRTPPPILTPFSVSLQIKN